MSSYDLKSVPSFDASWAQVPLHLVEVIGLPVRQYENLTMGMS